MTKRQLRHSIRGLVLEQLESRRLLSGNVSASRQGNTLVIRGDNDSNAVAIQSLGGNSYRVGGFETTVNGKEEATFRGIRNINLDMRGGDDLVGIADDPTGLDEASMVIPEDSPTDLETIGTPQATFVEGNLTIRTGSGSDFVSLAVDVHQAVDISTGGGNDRVDVLTSHTGKGLDIRTEEGDDGVTVLDSFVDSTLSVELGKGVDGLLVQLLDAQRIVAKGGQDRDQLGFFDIAVKSYFNVSGENGDDDLEVEFVEANSLRIDGGDGDDAIDADGNEIFGSLTILGGNGSDGVEVEPVDDYIPGGDARTTIGGALVIDGGAGDDALEAELVQARSITMIGGSGDDKLDVDGDEVTSFVIVDAGSGNDDVEVMASDDDEFEPGIESAIAGYLHVLLGSGDDVAVLADTLVGKFIRLNAGAGNDTVAIENVAAVDYVLALMGAGNSDNLRFVNVRGKRIELDGGSGNNDTLLIDFTAGDNRRIRNFENVILD